MADIALSIKNINKSFGATKANQQITLDIKRGSVHGLAGENGSGKSTLSSIISGIQPYDSGNMEKDGKPYKPSTPLAANKHGVAMVVQELGVVGSLSPAVNMFIGSTNKFSKGGIINLRKIKAAARASFEKWGLTPVPLDGIAEALSIEQRKVLELARALTADPDFLVLDEISQVLSHDNRKMLYRFIEEFTAQGKTILLITHDLEEMIQICDTVSVLRDGELIATKSCDEIDSDQIKHLMIGREIEGDYYRTDKKAEYEPDIVLKAEHLSVPGQIRNVSFELHCGEILGVCGLSDAGIHALGTALFGLAEKRTGSVTYVPGNKQLNTTLDVVNTKGAYLSKDRDAYGLMLQASIFHNISVPNAVNLTGKFLFLSPRRLRKLTEKAAKDFDIKAANTDQVTNSLSGGNKQKVNLSRWLVKDLDYIILDSPTRGVDVGVKAYIYHILVEAKKKGLGILLITDELSEAMGMADRIMVLKDHECVSFLDRETDFTEEKIVEVML